MQKRSFFSVSLYKYEDCSFFFLKWLEQEAHLLYSRQNTKDEELSYHGGKTRLMSLSGSINKTKFLLPPKCLDQVNFTFSLRRFAIYDGPKNKFITCAIISNFQFFSNVSASIFGDFGVLLASKFWFKHQFFKRQVCISVASL